MRPREKQTLGTELAQASVSGRTLAGYASVFNYPIDSGVRGMRQTTYVKPGAFTQTLKNNRDQIQVFVNHGMDPHWGMTPVATVRQIEQDSHGLKVAADIIDDPFFDPLVSTIAQGGFRAMSIQFETIRESFSDDRSERHLNEVKLWEFGPVAFPANEASTLSVHAAFIGEIPDIIPTRHQMMPMPTTAAAMRRHLVEDHGMPASEADAMPMDQMRAMHRQKHDAGAGHDHSGMMSEFHWDGAAALRSASTAAEFRKIAFERNNDSDPDTAAHWALPHHPSPDGAPGNADSGGVAAALAALHGGRGGAPDLKMSVASVESHLQGHQAETSSVESRGEDAHTLDEHRLTWARDASHRLELEDEELERFAKRLARLKG